MLVLSLCLPGPLLAQQQSSGYSVDSRPPRPLIVSPAHPQDSRGEPVYEMQGDSQKDVPIVPGNFMQAVPLKIPTPKYPESLEKTKSNAEVNVSGVIAQNGDFIDPTFAQFVDPEIRAAVLKAVTEYRFRPATLNGKPIAEHVMVNVKFQIR